MSRNISDMSVTLIPCPHCDALCVEGHDDDLFQTCGNCGKPFHRFRHSIEIHFSKSYLDENYVKIELRPGLVAYRPNYKR